ncbi:hypothetical protein HanIR_Chr11g0557501 [Helianthus annuus]|nr:hypothetical protein HanIR_Chr11g0557501 [Helianthus annuus]
MFVENSINYVVGYMYTKSLPIFKGKFHSPRPPKREKGGNKNMLEVNYIKNYTILNLHQSRTKTSTV